MKRAKRGEPGWVYVLVNGGISHHYKIGATRADPDDRAYELSRPTGVPCVFEVLCAVLVPDPFALEETAHRRYKWRRPNDAREFFVFTERADLLELRDWLVDLDDLIDFREHEDFDYWLGLLPAVPQVREVTRA